MLQQKHPPSSYHQLKTRQLSQNFFAINYTSFQDCVMNIVIGGIIPKAILFTLLHMFRLQKINGYNMNKV
jgi:hypothetical protein